MNKYNVFIKLMRMIGDILFINLSYIIAFYLRYRGDIPARNFSAFVELFPYISIVSIIIIQLYSLYSNQLKKELEEIFYSLIPASCLIALVTVVLSYFVQTYAFPRSVLIISVPIMILIMIIWRYYSLKLEKLFIKPQDIVVLGSPLELKKLVSNIKKKTNGGYRFKGVILRERNDAVEKYLESLDIPVFLGFDDLKLILKRLDPEVVFLATGFSEEEKKKIIFLSIEENWEIAMVPDFYEIIISGAHMESIGEYPVFEVKPMHIENENIMKRLADVMISLLGLVITLPVTIMSAIVIKLESRGPVLFAQERVTRDGRVFKVYKFRTMIVDAESKTGPVLASKNDQRITRVGKFLRKTRLDEVPQLYNVLKGDMSLIGPRPERPYFVKKFEEFIPEYKYRHQVKSGVTGLAQISGYYSTSPEDKLRMDLLYASNSSILLDFKIILHTIKVMLMGHKAS